MKKNEPLYITIAVVFLVVVMGGTYWYVQKQNSYIFNPQFGIQSPSTSPNLNAVTPNVPAGSTTKSAPANKEPVTLSYSAALKTYSNRRIQFSVNSSNYCLVNPYSNSFFKGTKIMLDNRSSKTLTIYLDGTPYSLKGYDFRIVTLTTSGKLPHTMRIDCGTGKNNGNILIR